MHTLCGELGDILMRLVKSHNTWTGNNNREAMKSWFSAAKEKGYRLALKILWLIWITQNKGIFQNKYINMHLHSILSPENYHFLVIHRFAYSGS
jgi:hypothetical protein